MKTKTRKPRKPTQTVWAGCYDDSWKGLITDESFAHPAKMARGLVSRIFTYLLARDYIRQGDTIVDPFGGIGTTAIEGASRGCRVICCELEERFVGFARENFELHRRTWEASGDPLPVIVQGDSRHLVNVLARAVADGVIGSPPFQESSQAESRSTNMTAGRGARGGDSAKRCKQDYAELDTPGNLAGLAAGDVDAAIGSPP